LNIVEHRHLNADVQKHSDADKDVARRAPVFCGLSRNSWVWPARRRPLALSRLVDSMKSGVDMWRYRGRNRGLLGGARHWLERQCHHHDRRPDIRWTHTYAVNKKQYVSIPAGNAVFTFALRR
jgi:hypothetical protein